jgi:O-antigen ligase
MAQVLAHVNPLLSISFAVLAGMVVLINLPKFIKRLNDPSLRKFVVLVVMVFLSLFLIGAVVMIIFPNVD